MAYQFPTEVSKQTGHLLISVQLPPRFAGHKLDADVVEVAAAKAAAEIELMYPSR